VGNRKFNTITGGFLILIVLIVVLMMANSLRRTSHITLPDPSAAASASGSGTQSTEDAVIRVEVTPETVQAAVATLKRPESYVRLLTVERLWSGGSGTVQIAVTVSGELTRADTKGTDGHVRHMITNGQTTYVWYDEERTYYTGAAGDISADEEQSILTYEDVLALDVDQITTADYRVFSNEESIYVETGEDAAGYVLRYWVSVDSGLLIGAEKLQSGTAVYRMASQPVTETLPTAKDFTLPDGTVLWKED